ncbi:SDR family NAD(P)-dependent oxidoreductase [Flavobacterium rhizosphaerae]|uniref:SDR family NAD(P)-dependent oxidoreductase n=1 Tax=Flavobacterium rhizosphaerae TaxID=3163298 RepID=A0ABW8Z047_9FLAO
MKTWFITGASQGFGLEFITQLLRDGNNVAATSRSLSGLEKAAGTHPNLLPLEVDIVNEQSVKTAIEKTIAAFGNIDVVVNNAGYGQLGALEELSDAEARKNFDVNVFGALNVIRYAMPQLRKQGKGHIINISSIAGLTGNFAGWGIYCATKFAMAGFTESLAAEVKPFGIKTTLVLPGYFRTNFLEGSSLSLPKNALDAYSEVRESTIMHQNQINGNQPGDPKKGVSEIIKVVNEEKAPLYLMLGTDAVQMAENKVSLLENEIEAWKTISVATDF